MKLCVSYSNCQGAGLIHYLRQTPMATHYEFRHYNNYQLIVREQSADDLFRDAARCDLFVCQPTPAIQYCDRSTESIIAELVPSSARKLSFGYGFNHGLFPLIHHGQWHCSEEVLALARADPAQLLARYDADDLSFGCQSRFDACVAEQARREEPMDIHMADYVAATYRRHPLFICENHPASAYFAELAHRFLQAIEPVWDVPLPVTTWNDAGLPCGMLVAPQVVRELDLSYPPHPDARAYFRGWVEQLIKHHPAA